MKKKLSVDLFLLTLGVLFLSPVASAQEINSVIKANNQFAFDLYSKYKSKEGNIFYSPYSISSALAMTYAGARNNTAAQMENVLHFNLPQDQLHTAFSNLMQDLYASPKEDGYQLSIANALWGQKGYPFLDEFLNRIEESYKGGFNEVDFAGATEQSRQIINKWIEGKTKDKIKDLLSPGDINSLTTLVLTNAIYFKGTWDSSFKKQRTTDAAFTLLIGEDIKVPTMQQTKKFNYTEDEQMQILEMPYAGNRLSMVIFLPKKKDGIKQAEQALTINNIDHWLSSLSKQKVDVRIPRFKMTSKFYLGKVLGKMGMTDAFSLPPADFSGMTGKRDLYISKVIHKAFVDVNEEGTEAAAATAVVATTEIRRIQEVKYFTADHPFIFVIRDIKSKSILFMGRVMDPRE